MSGERNCCGRIDELSLWACWCPCSRWLDVGLTLATPAQLVYNENPFISENTEEQPGEQTNALTCERASSSCNVEEPAKISLLSARISYGYLGYIKLTARQPEASR